MDLSETGMEGAEWMPVADRDQWQTVMNTVMNFRVP